MKKHDDAYLGNMNLKSSGVKLNFTQEQIKEYLKCAKDPVYFIKNYVKIVNLDKGLMPFEMYKFQEDMVRTMHANRFTIAKLARQSGKCVYHDTIIKVRNKITGIVKEIAVGELYETIKDENIS